MRAWLDDPRNRTWLYRVLLAAVPLLVAFGAVSEDTAPLWVALIGAVVGPAVALGHISPPVTRGDLDIPTDIENEVPLDLEDEA